MSPTDQEVETFLRDAFEQNFELLKLESGHSLGADIKDFAWNQILFYWRKLKDIATRVTETEVRLNLPNQESPGGRKFGIEGVVDIVREEDKTVMYDIKTHEADQVRENIEDYERQLNIYAHIWKNLRGQPLDATTIIATAYPDSFRDALKESPPNREKIYHEFQKWNPLVEIEFDPVHVEEVIDDFGTVVDCIEGGNYAPAPTEKLRTRSGRERREFASHVCRYCDARYSCSSYREYALASGGRAEVALRQYLTDFGTDLDQQDWLTGNLEVIPAAEVLE
jgi:hypothetical protein